MSNLEVYNNAFVEGLDMVPGNAVNARRAEIEKWDSIGHMSLIAILEDEFQIEFDPRDILIFDSYNKGIEILGKYGVVIEE